MCIIPLLVMIYLLHRSKAIFFSGTVYACVKYILVACGPVYPDRNFLASSLHIPRHKNDCEQQGEAQLAESGI